MATKYIFVTGGVVSSVGKGITTAAIGRLLKSRNVSVVVQKLDPYLNVDPGTMSPYQHGEGYVTAHGPRGGARPHPPPIHVTLLPYISTPGELKTKPTQHSVRELRSVGIQPD